MSGRWFRFYDGAVDDPKVQRLPAALFKFWVNLLCMASRNGGELPALADMAFTLRMAEKVVTANISLLIDAGLVDELDGVSTPHNWNARQFKSDVSNDRVKRHRERHKTVTGNDDVTLHVTPPETEADTESETEQKEDISLRSIDADAPKSAQVTTLDATEKPVKTSKKKPIISLPDDCPSPGLQHWAVDFWKGKQRLDLCQTVHEQVEKFRDYAMKDDVKHADWTAAWRYWCRNALRFNQDVSQKTGARNGGQTANKSFGATISEVVDQRAARGGLFGGGDAPVVVSADPRHSPEIVEQARIPWRAPDAA